MINVSVMWPKSDDATFDHDYYLQTHIPMLVELLGDTLKKVEVDRGSAGSSPGRRRPTSQSLTCTSTRLVTSRRPLALTPSG